MKSFGFFLVSAGFLVSALFTVLSREAVSWVGFVPAFIAGVVGIVLVRIGTKRHHHSEEVLATNVQAIETSLNSLVDSVTKFDEEKESIFVYDLAQTIDDRFRDDLDKFVVARESIAHAYGLQGYANVMSHFAAGERYLNRVWSCSVDGYIDEAQKYVTRAREQFVEANQLFTSLKQAPAA